jgi:aminoglycoside phosphotransferase (APT) family kinase protein
MPVPWVGATSRVFPCADVVVKIPFDEPSSIQAVRIDACVAPVMRSLGVATPELIAFDDAQDILTVPFAIFRRVMRSETLDRRTGDDASWREAWEDTGRQLARIHSVRECGTLPCELRSFRQTPGVDPRPWVEEFCAKGTLDVRDARWLLALLDILAPSALAELPDALCHGDSNAANILIDRDSGQFRALIDWAGAGWLDPVWDFAAVPLDVVPYMLAGHRECAPLPLDDTAEARICWCQVQTRLYAVRQAPPDAMVRQELARHIDEVRRFAQAMGL